MSIRLHIDRLIVDGLPLTPAQASGLHANVEARLAELLLATPPATAASHAVDAIRAMPIDWGASASSPAHAIAESVHAALAPKPRPQAKPAKSHA